MTTPPGNVPPPKHPSLHFTPTPQTLRVDQPPRSPVIPLDKGEAVFAAPNGRRVLVKLPGPSDSGDLSSVAGKSRATEAQGGQATLPITTPPVETGGGEVGAAAAASAESRVNALRDQQIRLLLGDETPIEGTNMTVGAVLRGTLMARTKGIAFKRIVGWKFPETDAERARFTVSASEALNYYNGLPLSGKQFVNAHLFLVQQELLTAVPEKVNRPNTAVNAGRSFLRNLAASFIPFLGDQVAGRVPGLRQDSDDPTRSYDPEDERRLAAAIEVRVRALVASQLGKNPTDLNTIDEGLALSQLANYMKPTSLILLYPSDWDESMKKSGRSDYGQRTIEGMAGQEFPEYQGANPEQRMAMTLKAFRAAAGRVTTLALNPAPQRGEIDYVKRLTHGEGLSIENYIRRNLGEAGVKGYNEARNGADRLNVERQAAVRAFSAQYGVLYAISPNSDKGVQLTPDSR